MKLLPTPLLLLLFVAARAADPTAVDAAKALFEARKLPEAQAALEKLAAAEPANTEVAYYRGLVAGGRGEFDAGIAHLENAVKLAPQNAAYHRALGDLCGQAAKKASLFSQPGLAKKCLAAYQRAAELDPASVSHHQALFEFYRQAPAIVGGGRDKALAEAATIKKLDAARGRAAFATIYAADKKFDDAVAAFDDKAEGNFFVSQFALRADDGEQAAAFGEKAVALAPTVARYQAALGAAYGRAAQKASIFSQYGLAKKCLTAFQRAAELEPGNADYHANLFEYYRQAPGIAGGGSDKAAAEAEAIKKIDASRGRIAFATLYVADKKYDLALAQFDEVLKTNPDDYAALYQVGKVAAISGQYLDRGLAALRHGLELTPGKGEPSLAAAQWRIGNILEKKNDKPAARAAYEASLKLDPLFTTAADALKKLK